MPLNPQRRPPAPNSPTHHAPHHRLCPHDLLPPRQAPPAKRTPGNLLQRGKPSLLLPRQQSIGSGSDLESPELSPLESPAGIEMPSECALESPVLGTASSLGSELAMEEMSEGSL
jgi:hypothetical protein